MKRKIVSILLIGILITTINMPAIFAQTAQEKKDQLEDQLDNAKDEKEEITNQKNDILDEIDELEDKIVNYESEIESLNSKISKLKESIAKNEKEIKKLEKEFQEKQDAFIERIVAIYEAGQTTYLDVLLSSDSVVSFISNYHMISELAEADKAMMDSIKAEQEKIEKAKKELEDSKKEVEDSKKEVEKKTSMLNNAKDAKETKVKSLSAKEKQLQAKIDQFKAAIKEADKQIQEELRKAQQQSGSSGGAYQGSFEGVLSWPLSSSHNIITSTFGPRSAPTAGASSNHGAVDIAVSYAPVYAPAAGKVIIAKYLGGYGKYVLIDHGNGYYTGFGHLSAFSVSAGTTVSRGQQIATSGNTGISTGPHLHYELHIGGYAQSDRVDPLQYTSHPALVYY